jgi:transcriptional regulator with XRE-family HTH domain
MIALHSTYDRAYRRGMVRRQQLIDRRTYLGHTQETVAHSLGVTAGTVGSWERGTSSPTPRHRRPLAELLEVSLPELDRILDGQGPIAPSGHHLGDWINLHAQMEQGAGRSIEFEPVLIPGLLQSRQYAFAVERASPHRSTEDEIARRVRVRLDRQLVLEREPDPLELFCLIGEAALTCRIGSRATMVEQLGLLLIAMERPNIDVRIVPHDERLAPIGYGSFQLLTKRGTEVPFMACSEDPAAKRYHEDVSTIGSFSAIADYLTGVALPPFESANNIRTILENFR